MLGKIVPAKGAEGGRGFRGAVDYITQDRKVAYVFAEGVASFETAIADMGAVAAMNPRVEDPVYHLVLTWPSYETPTQAQVQQAVAMQMRALGFAGHQYVAAFHTDTDHPHVHVVINKVSPVNFRAVAPRGDYFIVDRTCREIEVEQGWTHDRGPHVVEYVGTRPFVIEAKDRALLKALSEGAKAIERYSGEISFERWVRESEVLAKVFSRAQTWQAVHDGCMVLGLRLNILPTGLSISDLRTEAHAAAGHVQGYSFKDLCRRLGEPVASVRGTEHEVAQALADLTRDKSVFSERHLNAYLINNVDEARRDELKEAIMDSAECVHLEAEELPGRGEDDEKRVVARFTTREVLAEERMALDAAKRLAADTSHRATDAAIAEAIGSRSMRDDQLSAFRKTLEGGALSVVRGAPGVGKSYTMLAWRDAYEASGFKVVGLAPTNEVVAAERKDGFRDAMTVDSALLRADLGRLDWDSKTILVADEAAMISNGRTARLLKLAADRGCKVILVGDQKQLPPVERGGCFGLLAEAHSGGEITQITRQKEARQREAAQHLSDGRFEDAMAIFHEEGRLKWSGTDDEARDALLAAYLADLEADPRLSAEDGKGMRFVISYRNADVDWFNARIHEARRVRGDVTDCRMLTTSFGQAEYGVGDAIQFSTNDRKLGVANGTRGVISAFAADGSRMTVALADGKTVEVPLTKRDPVYRVAVVNGRAQKVLAEQGVDAFEGFRHGYSGTVYRAQGSTLLRVFLHHSKDLLDSAGLVALTRMEREAFVFASRETAQDWREMARQMARSMTKTCASTIPVAAAPHAVGKVPTPTDKTKETDHVAGSGPDRGGDRDPRGDGVRAAGGAGAVGGADGQPGGDPQGHHADQGRHHDDHRVVGQRGGVPDHGHVGAHPSDGSPAGRDGQETRQAVGLAAGSGGHPGGGGSGPAAVPGGGLTAAGAGVGRPVLTAASSAAVMADTARINAALADKIAAMRAARQLLLEPSPPVPRGEATHALAQAALALKDPAAAARAARLKAVSDRLYGVYAEESKADLDARRHEWAAKVADLRGRRDGEIAALREKHARDLEIIARGPSKKGLTEADRTALIGRYVAERVRPEIAEVRARFRGETKALGRRPDRVTLDDWLAKRAPADPEAAELLAHRRKLADRRAGQTAPSAAGVDGGKIDAYSMIDLHAIPAQHGWTQAETVPLPDGASTVFWQHEDGRRIAVQTDADGRGVRFFDPQTRKGGGARPLAALVMGLDPKDKAVSKVVKPLLKTAEAEIEAARENAEALEEVAGRFERATLDVVDARAMWSEGVPLSGFAPSDLVGTRQDGGVPVSTLVAALEDGLRDDVRVTRTPTGLRCLVGALRNDKGDVVGFEVAVGGKTALVRGTAVGRVAPRLGPALEALDHRLARERLLAERPVGVDVGAQAPGRKRSAFALGY